MDPIAFESLSDLSTVYSRLSTNLELQLATVLGGIKAGSDEDTEEFRMLVRKLAMEVSSYPNETGRES